MEEVPNQMWKRLIFDNGRCGRDVRAQFIFTCGEASRSTCDILRVGGGGAAVGLICRLFILYGCIFISVRASDADLWDTFVMSEEEELWFSLFSLENLATKC